MVHYLQRSPDLLFHQQIGEGSLYEIKQTWVLWVGWQVIVDKLADGKCQKLISELWVGGKHMELRTNDRAFLRTDSLYSPANSLPEIGAQNPTENPLKPINSKYIL